MRREQRTEHHLLLLEHLQLKTAAEVIEVKETSALSPVSMPLSAASLRSVHVHVVVFFVVPWSIETGRPEFAKL